MTPTSRLEYRNCVKQRGPLFELLQILFLVLLILGTITVAGACLLFWALRSYMPSLPLPSGVHL